MTYEDSKEFVYENLQSIRDYMYDPFAKTFTVDWSHGERSVWTVVKNRGNYTSKNTV